MPRITMGKRFSGFVPALDRDVDFVVTFISVEADFATWNATRTQGGFDVRTFAVKAKPVTAVEYMRPGMRRHRGLGFDRVAQSYVGIFP